MDANKEINVFEEKGIKVLNGMYGPYVTNGKVNAKIPKDVDPKSLDEATCVEMIKNAPKAKYQTKTTDINETQLEMVKKIHLPLDAYGRLKKECNKLGIDNVALSFANRAEDVNELRTIVGENISIISKIESRKGLMNLDDIIKESDEILIARGDLSKEVRIEKIPFIQRNVIAHAKALSTPVHVATNLLESMIGFNQPNRAEVNDIISTLLMGADGLVLAGETAVGEFPVECVQMIRKLIDQYNQWTPNSGIEDILNSLPHTV